MRMQMPGKLERRAILAVDPQRRGLRDGNGRRYRTLSEQCIPYCHVRLYSRRLQFAATVPCEFREFCLLFARRPAPKLSSMRLVRQARSADEIESVRSLMREYQQRLGVDLGFQGFEAELNALPGSYSPPHGRLLLALHEQTPVGCVALQRISDSRAEMKRLYVPPRARGLGVGRTLVTHVLAEAQAIGYSEVVLDTLPGMVEAQSLYERFGFRAVAPYRPNPIAGTRYLARYLDGSLPD